MKTYQLHPNTDEKEDFVLLNVDFEEINECETYDKYGQIVGCHDAGCYSIDNCDCDFVEDLIIAINKEFNLDCNKDVYFDDLQDILDELELTDNVNIKQFAKNWVEEETEHTLCKSYDYYDGSNYKSLILENMGDQVDLIELNDDLNNKIIEEYNKIEECQFVFKNGIASVETENYIFKKSNFSWMFAIANIEIL